MTNEDDFETAQAAWSPEAYYDSRYRPDPNRDRVWQHITQFLLPYFNLPENPKILELGCGYGSWIRSFYSQNKFALDIHPDVPSILARQGQVTNKQDSVIGYVGSCTDLSRWEDETLDLVLASNLLEHLSMNDVLKTLREASRVLKESGVICVIQPNFAICASAYFDDFTHVSIFTDRSLSDVMAIAGLTVKHKWRRFLPFSMNPTTSRLAFLVPIYLRSPLKPMAGQMCLIAQKFTQNK